MPSSWRPTIGADVRAEGTRFRVWAPAARAVDVVLYGPDAERVIPLEAEDEGYFAGTVEDAFAGTRYRYRLDGAETYPDPASRYQPEGVHGPSEVVDPANFVWSDSAWLGLDRDRLVIYEMHVGTFTDQGTFRAAIERLDHLVELNVTAIEVMPVANFPGSRNWGYDGVNLFAPATAYGEPDDFKAFVDAAHRRGLGVILDVVYNHLGPEGNYIPAVTGGRFFTDRHHTPWGDGVNFDGPESGPVRDFVVQNAIYWACEYHVDGLRLDATHAILDDSPTHVVQEIARALHRLTPRRVVIAEDERNARALLLSEDAGGLGLDAVWADDLHHQLRRMTAGDSEGYFAAYGGTMREVVETLWNGWYLEGTGSERAAVGEGEPAQGVRYSAFVHCIQNHDQVGNRALGSRLHHDMEPEIYRALSALLLVSPYTPLLWMGQEWAAASPFLYFTDHPSELGRLVTEGRREEFSGFSAFQDPERRERIPDPQAAETFARSRLDWTELEEDEHARTLALYRELLRLRAAEPALRTGRGGALRVLALEENSMALRREAGSGNAMLLVVCIGGEIRIDLQARAETRSPDSTPWQYVLSTEERRFGGSGAWGRLEPDGTLHLMGAGAVLLRSRVD